MGMLIGCNRPTPNELFDKGKSRVKVALPSAANVKLKGTDLSMNICYAINVRGPTIPAGTSQCLNEGMVFGFYEPGSQVEVSVTKGSSRVFELLTYSRLPEQTCAQVSPSTLKNNKTYTALYLTGTSQSVDLVEDFEEVVINYDDSGESNSLMDQSVSKICSQNDPLLVLSNIVGPSGVLQIPIASGWYEGSTMAIANDANLTPANIKSGTTIFGVTGTLTSSSYSSCSTPGAQSNACTADSGTYWSSTVGTNVNGTNGTLAMVIPTGYYTGSSFATASDSNLLPAKIVSGVTIFGVTGTASTGFSPCTDEALNAGQCSTAANRYVYTSANGGRSANCAAGFNGSSCWTNVPNQYVTGTVGGNITTWTNSSSTTTVDGTIPLGYYPGNSIAFTDADLLAANIKSGVSIFNVTGSYAGGGVTLMSNMHRDKTTTQISPETEAVTNSGTAYPNADPGYRAIPKISKDDDGYTGGSVTLVSRTNWDTTCDAGTGAGGGSANSVCKCGQSGTIDQRIADCAGHSVIGSNATWDGATKGNAGQGTWKLVTRTGALSATKGREVWRDERTKLIWSSLVSTSLNWCKATGSNFITNNPSAEDDPSNYCDNATYQTTGVWSAGVNKAISACFEDIDDNSASDFFTTSDAGIDNAGKASLSLSSTPRVDWRLPTIYDFKQADINGYRFVFPDTISNGYYEWSASVYSNARAYAWVFYGANGDDSNVTRSINNPVRCVGR
jgi:hypothetical protein